MDTSKEYGGTLHLDSLTLPQIGIKKSYENIKSLILNKNKGLMNSASTGTLETIQLTNRSGVSVKGSIDRLDLIPEFEEKSRNKVIKTENIIRLAKIRNRDRSVSSDRSDSIDLVKHSISILKNAQWGNPDCENIEKVRRDNSKLKHRKVLSVDSKLLINLESRDKIKTSVKKGLFDYGLS
jgi:hypothetical protein